MKIFYVYMLFCCDGTFYTGITSNLEKRIQQHKNGAFPDSYTYRRRPLVFVYSESFATFMDAASWEKRLQKWSTKKKIALIRGDWYQLSKEAKKRFSD